MENLKRTKIIAKNFWLNLMKRINHKYNNPWDEKIKGEWKKNNEKFSLGK